MSVLVPQITQTNKLTTGQIFDLPTTKDSRVIRDPELDILFCEYIYASSAQSRIERRLYRRIEKLGLSSKSRLAMEIIDLAEQSLMMKKSQQRFRVSEYDEGITILIRLHNNSYVRLTKPTRLSKNTQLTRHDPMIVDMDSPGMLYEAYIGLKSGIWTSNILAGKRGRSREMQKNVLASVLTGRSAGKSVSILRNNDQLMSTLESGGLRCAHRVYWRLYSFDRRY